MHANDPVTRENPGSCRSSKGQTIKEKLLLILVVVAAIVASLHVTFR